MIYRCHHCCGTDLHVEISVVLALNGENSDLRFHESIQPDPAIDGENRVACKGCGLVGPLKSFRLSEEAKH